MLANVKSVWSVIVRCDLDGKLYAIANVLNKAVSCPVIALPDFVRKDQFCVAVDTAPQPKIAAFFFWIYQPASMRSDVLPLLVHLDSDARQIAEIGVHVIGERFAGFTDNTPDSFLVCLEHARDCSHRSPFTERRQN